jgi:hypothetical protein
MDRNATQTGKRERFDGKTATLMNQQVQKEESAVNVPYLTHNSFR